MGIPRHATFLHARNSLTRLRAPLRCAQEPVTLSDGRVVPVSQVSRSVPLGCLSNLHAWAVPRREQPPCLVSIALR